MNVREFISFIIRKRIAILLFHEFISFTKKHFPITSKVKQSNLLSTDIDSTTPTARLSYHFTRTGERKKESIINVIFSH